VGTWGIEGIERGREWNGRDGTPKGWLTPPQPPHVPNPEKYRSSLQVSAQNGPVSYKHSYKGLSKHGSILGLCTCTLPFESDKILFQKF